MLALESFKNASLFDPTWESPKIKQEQLLKYLNEIVDLVTTHGKMKAKRLQQLLQVWARLRIVSNFVIQFRVF